MKRRNKMGMMKEFRDFAVRGNVVDMAVGVVIGGAFGKRLRAEGRAALRSAGAPHARHAGAGHGALLARRFQQFAAGG